MAPDLARRAGKSWQSWLFFCYGLQVYVRRGAHLFGGRQKNWLARSELPAFTRFARPGQTRPTRPGPPHAQLTRPSRHPPRRAPPGRPAIIRTRHADRARPGAAVRTRPAPRTGGVCRWWSRAIAGFGAASGERRTLFRADKRHAYKSTREKENPNRKGQTNFFREKPRSSGRNSNARTKNEERETKSKSKSVSNPNRREKFPEQVVPGRTK